jgi:hypothetical protein
MHLRHALRARAYRDPNLAEHACGSAGRFRGGFIREAWHLPRCRLKRSLGELAWS